MAADGFGASRSRLRDGWAGRPGPEAGRGRSLVAEGLVVGVIAATEGDDGQRPSAECQAALESSARGAIPEAAEPVRLRT
jgi:hypothetical protein